MAGNRVIAKSLQQVPQVQYCQPVCVALCHLPTCSLLAPSVLQVSCEACTVRARQAFFAELVLHAGMGEGAGMAEGAEIWAKYRGRLGRARATA